MRENREKKGSGAERKNERKRGNSGTVVLDLKGLLLRLLTWAVSVTSQGVSLRTDPAYVSCQPERQALVFFSEHSEHSSGGCCGETIQLLDIIVVRD